MTDACELAEELGVQNLLLYHTEDMRHMDAALTQVGVAHELIDPLSERGLEMLHCFVASEGVDEVARDGFERTLAFLEEQIA